MKMANTRGIKFVTFLVLALSFSLFVAEGHRGLATPPTCTCQNNNNNNDNNNNDVSKNNDAATSTTNKNNNNAATTTNNNNNNAATTTNKNNNNASTTHKNNKDATTTTTKKNTTTTTNNSSSSSNTTTKSHSSSNHDSSSHSSSSSHNSNSHSSTTTNKNSHSSSTTTNGNTSSNNTTSNSSGSSNTTNNNTTNNSSNNNKNNNNSSGSSSSSNNNTNNNNNNNNDHTTTTTTNNNNNNGVYDVTTFGAQGNGKAVYKNGDSMNGIALIQAWQKACYTTAVSSKVVIPKGTFAVATVVFAGPCKTNNITIELQGNLVADSDVSQFPNHEFIVFQNVNGVTFTGQGTLDVSTQVNKSCDPTKNDADIFNQFSSIKLYRASNVVVEGVTSVNPSSRHVLVVESQKVTIRNVKFNEKSVASNTKSNGIYISASSQVSVSNSIINTGEECVTISPGCNSISITGLTCAGGKGISIGSLAFLENVLDVKGVLIKNCLFKGTAFGVSINPRLEARLSLISDINVEDLVMDGVQNPIVIKQQDDRFNLAQLIHARIMNVHFKNINGSVTTKNALSFSCSLVSPCEGITVDDVDLNFTGNVALQGNGGLDIIGKTIDHLKGLESLVNCLHAKVVFGGKHKGLSCGLLQ